MSEPAPSPSKAPWWLETLLWTLGMIIAVGVAAYMNETVREVVAQGLGYFFGFLSTPFILEASTALVGLCIVLIINSRRIEREGDGWVMMEIKESATVAEAPGTEPTAVDKASQA